MASIIDSCFGQKRTRNATRYQQNHFQPFIQATTIEFQKKLLKLSKDTYCVVFGSKNQFTKIKYFTIIDVFQFHVNLKIIPYDSNGCVIRSKQNFNKNGWIRKHINQNKNKFLKINPLTGEVYFKYSCFLPERLKILKFWNQLLQKIIQIQKELPQLLNKIINLQGKQKPLGLLQQAIQTNKVVFSIKMAEMFRQNIRIEDQFHKFNPETGQKIKKTSQYNQKSQIKNYAIQAKKLQANQSQKITLKKIHQDFLFYRKVLQNGSMRAGKSNVSSLTLTKQDEDKLKSKIRNMKYRQETRFKIRQFNREMFVQIIKQEEDTVTNIKRLLGELNNQVEYLFLDTYFDQIVFEDVIMTLALKQVPLSEYLWKNFQTISYQTKFRILIQTLNSITMLWLKNQISFQDLGINSFTVTKNLTVKMKKLSLGRYIHPSRLATQEALSINNQKKQIVKQFSNIYFDIFFNRKGPAIRTQKFKNKNQKQCKSQDLIFESLNDLTKHYYPNNLFTLIIGLNYFFIQQYFTYFDKKTQINKENQNLGGYHLGGSFGPVKNMEYVKQLQQAKKGTVRVDLILTMIIQFLQEHESQSPDKGGQM